MNDKRTRQFVAVRFRSNDRRTYTYHNDGPPVAEGDEVKVPDRAGDGWQRVKVASVTEAVPSFATKAILGRFDGEALDEKLLKAGAAVPFKADPFRDYVEDVRSGLAGPNLFGDA